MTTNELEMHVIKRDGTLQEVSFDKILKRVKTLGAKVMPALTINYSQLIMKVIDQLYDKIPTYVIDELTAEQCASLNTKHVDYTTLANRIIVSNNHKNTLDSFHSTMKALFYYKDIHGLHKPLISEHIWNVINSEQELLDKMVDYERDYLFDYFGFKTLERSYLMRINNVVVERPQHMWLRVALGIHIKREDATTIKERIRIWLMFVKETYDLMSTKYFTHATPTLYNAGTAFPQLSSCYLLAMESDSIDGIYNTLKDCARISKWAGGIGLHIHNIRATDTQIVGTNGKSNGIVPMLQVFNSTARYVDQGGGKRNGSFAIYLEPWHADIESFLDLKKNHGDEDLRARDLFYALWVPDLFMEKVKQDEDWALFCPHKCPGLADCYGEAFRTLYNTYVSAGKANKLIKARVLWFKILDSQMETGTPYLLYKDAANKKSNQKNLGVIKSSNLCVAPETLILTDKGYFAIHSLAGLEVNVWNGEEYSTTTICKTGVDKELLTVETSDGCTLDCTPYHKFYIERKNGDKTSVDTIEAQNLEIGDTLINCEFPIIDDRNKVNFITLYTVPINANISTKMNWLTQYCQDVYNSNIVNDILYISNSNKHFVMDIKLMLQTCGINAVITVDNIKPTLIVNGNRLLQLLALGFTSLQHLTIRLDKPPYRLTSDPVTIKNITRTGRISDTYCFNETNKHAGIFNGIITAQCTEIIEYSDSEETAVCNLASISLSKFVNDDKTFNYALLHSVVKVVTVNLNKIIDINLYPTDKTRISNMLHRPIGIGVQGLADAFAMMDIAYHSDAALCVNKLIFETIYHAALEKSNEIAIARQSFMKIIKYSVNHYTDLFATSKYEKSSKQYLSNQDYIHTAYHPKVDNYNIRELIEMNNPIPNEFHNLSDDHLGAYSTFTGSPAANGLLQFDLWDKAVTSNRYDWGKLKEQIKTHGLRNSLLVAPMPTASTSQILGNNECFEPFTSNIYSRRTNAGEFVMVNKYLMMELQQLGLWNDTLKNNIIANKGSIQQIKDLPAHIKEKYKIVWEIPMKHLIDMAADRGAFICQSQSLNLWLEDPDYKTMTSMHFYSWEKGLKTGIYYLRRKAKHQAQQFTIVPMDETNNEAVCDMCSS